VGCKKRGERGALYYAKGKKIREVLPPKTRKGNRAAAVDGEKLVSISSPVSAQRKKKRKENRMGRKATSE